MLTEQELGQKLAVYSKNHQEFIEEKSDKKSNDKDTNQYKNRNLRRALKKYKNNLRFMFTFQQQDQDLKFPNTTNHIDGGLF